MTPGADGREPRAKDRSRKARVRAQSKRSQQPPTPRERARVGENAGGRKRAKGRPPDEQISVRQNKAHRRAVMSRERVEGRSQGTPFEAYFAPSPLSPDRSTLLFQHLQKTAGTALRQTIHANLVGEDVDEGEVEHVVLDVPKKNRANRPLRDLYEQWWSSLDQDRRDRLILATSHSANYLLDLIERSSRAFTILREPADRVLSRYYFYSSRPDYTLRELYDDPSRWPQARGWFFNYQSRALLEPHFDVEGDDLAMSNGPPENADLWRERLRSVLDERYVVGVQEHFAESVKLFADEFGWKRLIAPRVRVNSARPRELDDEEIRELILAYNWLDAEVHGEYARRIEESIAAADQGVSSRPRKAGKARAGAATEGGEQRVRRGKPDRAGKAAGAKKRAKRAKGRSRAAGEAGARERTVEG